MVLLALRGRITVGRLSSYLRLTDPERSYSARNLIPVPTKARCYVYIQLTKLSGNADKKTEGEEVHQGSRLENEGGRGGEETRNSYSLGKLRKEER